MEDRVSVREVDHGSEALLHRLDQRGGVRVGIIGSDAQQVDGGGDLTVVDVATKHEYGIGVPKRSFLRAYVDEHEARIKKYVRNVGKRIMDGEDVAEALNALGVVVVGEIRTRIANHIKPPNSQRCVDIKGSDTPLVDTGQLWSSITHAIDGRAPKADGAKFPGKTRG
jgi:hypothetical protein